METRGIRIVIHYVSHLAIWKIGASGLSFIRAVTSFIEQFMIIGHLHNLFQLSFSNTEAQASTLSSELSLIKSLF